MTARDHAIVSKFGSNQVARFFRANFSRDDAVAELDGQPARSFLIRVAAPDAVVISYVKPGSVIIHHRVFITPTGNLVPDGAAAGENFRTLHALLAAKGFVSPLDESAPSVPANSVSTSTASMPTVGYGNTPSLGAGAASASAAVPPGSAVDALHARPELARFFCTHSRERVCQLLSEAPDDTFMLRASSAGDGSIALSFKDRGNIRHCRILRDARGFFVDGDDDRSPTLVQVLRTFNFKIPDAAAPAPAPLVVEQTPTPGYATPQQMFNMQPQPVAGYGGIPVGPDPSNAYGRTPGPAPTPGYVGVPDSLRVNATPGYVGVPDSLRVNNGERSSSGGYGNVPEALASGGYGALPTGIVASFNAMNANTSSPSPNSRNVAVASAARPITNSNSGYAQLPGGGPIDVPPTPGARPYTGMPATNQKPTSSGYGAVPL